MSSTSLSRPVILLGFVAVLNGFIAVACGSFAAHGLQHYASAELLPTWQTGVRYHMFHVLAAFVAMVIAGLIGTGSRGYRWALVAGWLFMSGAWFFSGSLYLLVLAPQGWLMQTAPLGGGLFLLGWLALAVALIRQWFIGISTAVKE